MSQKYLLMSAELTICHRLLLSDFLLLIVEKNHQYLSHVMQKGSQGHMQTT